MSTHTDTPDWYQILGISPAASSAQITRAYRAGLRAYHPDTRLLDDPTDFARAAADAALRQVRIAYAILSDPTRRAAYDHQRDAADHQARKPVPQPITIHHHPTRNQDPPSIRAGPVHWHRRADGDP